LDHITHFFFHNILSQLSRTGIPVLMLLCIGVYELAAQDTPCNGEIKGTIYDAESREPLPYATVQIKDSSKGAVADINGEFILKGVCEEELDLVISYTGYKTLVHHHDAYHDHPSIYLAQAKVTLESVVVEGKQVEGELYSNTVSKLTPEEFEEGQSASLGDLASKISGVSVVKTGQNVSLPVIHGLYSNRILVINNGVRHEYQSWSSDHAPEIDPSTANEIKVIKGASAVKYGVGALGGVLLVNPPKMELSIDWNGGVSLAGQSNGQSGEGGFSVRKGMSNWAFMAEANALKQGDLQAPDYVLSNTGKEESSLLLGTRYHKGSFDLETHYSRFSQKLGILRGSVNGNLEDFRNALEVEVPNDTQPFTHDINTPYQLVVHNMLKVSANVQQKEQSFSLQYAYQHNARQEYDVRRGTNNEIPSIDLVLQTHSIDGEWKHPTVSGWSGSAGLQVMYQDNNNIPGTNTTPYIPNFNNYRGGVFLIESKEIQENTIEWGLRYDFQYSSIRGRESSGDVFRNSLNYQNLSGTVGWEKKVAKHQFLKSNFGVAWRPPSISELYAYGRHRSIYEYGAWRYAFDDNNNVVSPGDILTEKEKPVDSEVGYKWVNSYEIRNSQFNLELVGFINYLDNYLYSRPAGITRTARGVFPFYITDQTNALFVGADVMLKWEHSSKLASQLKAGYIYAENLEDGTPFVAIAPPSINYDLIYSLSKVGPMSNVSIKLSPQFTFEQFYHPRVITANRVIASYEEGVNLFKEDDSIFDFMAPPANYFLLNASIAGTLYDQFTVRFSVENALNTNYKRYTDVMRYYAFDTGRNFSLKIKYKF
jgi:iron complex outermembrane receptor protein